MLKRTLQHVLLVSSIILNPSTLFVCVKGNKNCSSNFTVVNQKISPLQKHNKSKFMRTRAKIFKDFEKQGLIPLKVPKSEMDNKSGAAESSKPDIMEPLVKWRSDIKGMKKLDKSAFDSTIRLPCVIVNHTDLHRVLYLLKTYVFKMEKLSSIQDCDEINIVEKSEVLKPVTEAGEPVGNLNHKPCKIYQVEGFGFKHNSKSKVVLLNPAYIQTYEDFGEDNKEPLAAANLSARNFAHCEMKVTYNNFSAEDILKAILPSMISSFTSVGHIVQCNLREEHEDYKFIIGQVLLEKIPTCETVVSKKHSINNTYRNFEMEVLAGKPDMITIHKENQCAYKMDFSKVYWNSRLSTEHYRVAGDMMKGDILFDVFAGIGPFAILSATKGVRVFANDLNPDSVHWLRESIKLNKHKIKTPITVVNKDAKEFMQTDVRENLLKWTAEKAKQLELDSKTLDPKTLDPNTLGPKTLDPKTLDPKTLDPKMLDPKTLDPKTLDPKKSPRVRIIMNLPASAIEFVKYLRVLSEDEFKGLDSVGTLYLYTFQPKMDLETKVPLTKLESTAALFKEHDLAFDPATMAVEFVRNVAPNKNMYKVLVPLTREVLVKRGEKREGEATEVEAKKVRVE